jgi:hypothetical protein
MPNNGNASGFCGVAVPAGDALGAGREVGDTEPAAEMEGEGAGASPEAELDGPVEVAPEGVSTLPRVAESLGTRAIVGLSSGYTPDADGVPVRVAPTLAGAHPTSVNDMTRQRPRSNGVRAARARGRPASVRVMSSPVSDQSAALCPDRPLWPLPLCERRGAHISRMARRLARRYPSRPNRVGSSGDESPPAGRRIAGFSRLTLAPMVRL